MGVYLQTTWPEFKAIFKTRFHTDFLSVDDVANHKIEGVGQIDWQSLGNWEDLDDLDILKYLKQLHVFDGSLHIVTEASYKDNSGPFKVDGSQLEIFVSNHLNEFGECFFNGDVLIVNCEEKNMWIFHHEGIFSFIRKK